MAHREARDYSSPLRQRQQSATRQLIMETVAALIAEGRIHTLSVQDVATRAGISYASVYRHFPTREKLYEGLYEWGSERIATGMPPLPGTLDEMPAWVRRSVEVAARYAEVNQAVATVATALDIDPESRRRRDTEIRALVAESMPGLEPALVKQASAVIRHLAGAQAWAAMAKRFGLNAEETASAIGWALDALVRDLKQRAPERGPNGEAGGAEVER